MAVLLSFLSGLNAASALAMDSLCPVPAPDPGISSATASPLSPPQSPAAPVIPQGVPLGMLSPTALISPLPPAGIIPTQLTLKLTGIGLSSEYIFHQIESALNRAVAPQSGVTLVMGTPDSEIALDPNSSTTVNVPVSLCGAGSFGDVSAPVAVTLQNVQAPPIDPEFLYYGDDPEYVTIDGVYLHAQVDPGHSVRVYDYHALRSHVTSRRIVTFIQALGKDPVSLHLLDSPGGPNEDIYAVGHKVTKDTILASAQSRGIVLDLTPGSPFIYRDVTLKSDDLFVQNMDLDILSGGSVAVTIVVLSPGVDAHSVDLSQAVVPGDGHNRHGRFRVSGYGKRTVLYNVQDESASTLIGTRKVMPPTTNPSDPGHDFGDYGITYDLEFDLNNPTANPQTVYLYEQAQSGGTTAVYFIDGDLKNPTEMECTIPSARYLITSFQVAPNSTESHHLLTMADGGSAFPLAIGASTTAPVDKIPHGICWAQPAPAVSPGPSPSPSPSPGVSGSPAAAADLVRDPASTFSSYRFKYHN